MNCIEFRRRYTTEPDSSNALLAAHRSECSACAQFARKIDIFEEQLREALVVDPPASLYARIGGRLEREAGPVSHAEFERHLGQALQVEIPKGLEGRIRLRQTQEQARKRRLWYAALALAASIVAMVGLNTILRQPGDRLAEDLIAHIEHEPEALMSQLEVIYI